MSFLQECGGHNFTPVQSEVHKGELETWRDLAIDIIKKHRTSVPLDEGSPSGIIGRCPYLMCKKVYTSVTDKRRHQTLVHKLEF